MPSDKKLEGILMPMPVAFKADGAIDHGATDAIIDFYLDAGVHGLPVGHSWNGDGDRRAQEVAEQIVNYARACPRVMHIISGQRFRPSRWPNTPRDSV
jgi:hypothetical protein